MLKAIIIFYHFLEVLLVLLNKFPENYTTSNQNFVRWMHGLKLMQEC